MKKLYTFEFDVLGAGIIKKVLSETLAKAEQVAYSSLSESVNDNHKISARNGEHLIKVTVEKNIIINE